MVKKASHCLFPLVNGLSNTKQAIVLCPSNRNWADIKSSTKSIVFMGTPHMGAEQAEKLVTIQTITSLIMPSTALAKNLSKELKLFSNSVMDISKEFTVDVHRSMELLCCYESHPQRLPGGSKEIVSAARSSTYQTLTSLDCAPVVCGPSRCSEPGSQLYTYRIVQILVTRRTALRAVLG